MKPKRSPALAVPVIVAALAGCNPVWVDLSSVQQPVLMNDRWIELPGQPTSTPRRIQPISCASYYNNYTFPAPGGGGAGQNRQDNTRFVIERVVGQQPGLFIANMKTSAITHAGFYWVFTLDKAILQLDGEVMGFGGAAPANTGRTTQ